MISTDDTPGAVSVTYQVQAPETNYATVASSLTSPTAVSSLSVALNKAGYRDALVDSAPTLVDISPTSAPTVASTLKVVMLTATQDVADVSVSQAASSEFQTAFLTGVIDVLQEADENLLSTGVKITTINADPSGSGVSVTYSVTENKASPKVLEDAIISPAMTNRINTDLHAAGKTFDNCIRSIHSINILYNTHLITHALTTSSPFIYRGLRFYGCRCSWSCCDRRCISYWCSFYGPYPSNLTRRGQSTCGWANQSSSRHRTIHHRVA